MLKHIFIVDDDPDLIDSLSTWLKRRGFLVEGFQNSGLLYTALDKQTPDLILLDIKMGDEDGRHVCKKIRERYLIKFPIILFSFLVDSIQDIKDFGADDFIKKDAPLMQLMTLIAKHLKVGYS